MWNDVCFNHNPESNVNHLTRHYADLENNVNNSNKTRFADNFAVGGAWCSFEPDSESAVFPRRRNPSSTSWRCSWRARKGRTRHRNWRRFTRRRPEISSTSPRSRSRRGTTFWRQSAAAPPASRWATTIYHYRLEFAHSALFYLLVVSSHLAGKS